ncbi:MAG TPA: transcription elongation factor Spt5 [Candidatus Bilamarchaeaceae archaeon]|nr:transcription elongation factor Spt5 [Candidatus Bilamarchaeaceae archaeon]
MIFTVRVTSGQEKITANILAKKATAERLPVYSVFNPENVRGYLFLEALDENSVVKLVQKVKHVKGVLRKSIGIEEIEKMLTAEKQQALQIASGDIIEMISGPFKGERARVTKIDEAKDEVTVELIEVAVPIPVTVKTKMVKLFQKAGAEE